MCTEFQVHILKKWPNFVILNVKKAIFHAFQEFSAFSGFHFSSEMDRSKSVQGYVSRALGKTT